MDMFKHQSVVTLEHRWNRRVTAFLLHSTGRFGACLPGTFDGCLENRAEGGGAGDLVLATESSTTTFEIRNDDSKKYAR